MRWTLNILTVLMVLGLAAFIMIQHESGASYKHQQEAARKATYRLHQEITLQATLMQKNSSGFHYPDTIDPKWFPSGVPQNPLLTGPHPWISICSVEDRLLDHPRNPLAADSQTAQFWYNPYRGLIRARIPADLNEADALALYNFINECARPALFATPPRN